MKDRFAARFSIGIALAFVQEREFCSAELATHPFARVARITIIALQDDIDSAEHQAQCERLVFTSWHSLAAHQPIGSINRLRKAVYEASAQHRLRQPEVAAGQ